MARAGGIISIIAGVFGTMAAVVTLMFGSIATAVAKAAAIPSVATSGSAALFGARGADGIVSLGWRGLCFSFLTIVLGAIATEVRGWVPGILLLCAALGGAALGGTLVAICMALAFAGGLVALTPPASAWYKPEWIKVLWQRLRQAW